MIRPWLANRHQWHSVEKLWCPIDSVKMQKLTEEKPRPVNKLKNTDINRKDNGIG
jgi:hypothetical protein